MSATRGQSPVPRLVSLDAYRGFVMLAMVSGGLGLPAVAEHFPQSRAWQFVAYQMEHVAWTGCAAWDLIQPSFMFIVGVAMPYSLAGRHARGDATWRVAGHVLWRALVLTLLGVFLRSNGRDHTNWTLEDVSSQIGLGYAFVFLTLGRGPRVQAAVAAVVLAAYWALFACWPVGTPELARATGVPDDWSQFTGFAAHWNKHLNPAGACDRWFLNLFPRPAPFVANGGGYQTLNFVPAAATILFGVMTGELLRGPGGLPGKVLRLAGWGSAALLLGLAVDGHLWPGGPGPWSVAPVVKKIWTPSWTVFSTGWTLVTLAAFVLVIDVLGWRGWCWPLVIVGMNSIAMYVLSYLFRPWVVATVKTHLGPEVFAGTYGPLFQSLVGVGVLWLVAWWLYRRGVFLRI